MQPFLKWAGGKRWLIPSLKEAVPDFHTYYEPFLGSGGLFFALEPKRAVLSDINPELINCYKCIRDHCEKVIRILRKLPVNKKTYYLIRDKLYRRSGPVKRAAFFIYINKTCWNGLYRVNHEGHFNVPVGRVGPRVCIFNEDTLHRASHLLKRARLKCCDFEAAVKTAGSKDLVYCDPPYITTHLRNGFKKYNSKLFHHADELRLAKTARLLARRRVSVVVSNAAHPLIKQQYDGPFYKSQLDRRSLVAADPANRSIFTELLITNFRVRLS